MNTMKDLLIATLVNVVFATRIVLLNKLLNSNIAFSLRSLSLKEPLDLSLKGGTFFARSTASAHMVECLEMVLTSALNP
jgi:hypothetical protein